VHHLGERGSGIVEFVRAKPPAGFRRRTRNERIAFGVGAAMLFGFQLVSHWIGEWALIVSGIGVVMVVVVGVRTFLYRDD